MMKKVLVGLLAIVVASGCSEKEKSRVSAPVRVRTMTVGTSSANGGQTYSGTIEEVSGTSLSFSSIGTVQRVNVAEGQFVQKGQLIGTLDVTAAQNAYDAALATKEQALDAQERLRQLHDAGSLPEIKWIEVQTQVRQAVASEQIAKKALTDTKLYAPFSGFISQKSVEAGANVAPGISVVRLVNIDQVKVKISVPEEEIAHFRQGQTLSVTIAALSDQHYEAKVTEKGVSADPLSRSYEVKAIIGNARHELLPGMLAEVAIDHSPDVRPTGDDIIVLPADIIQIDADNRPFVWTVVDGKAIKAFVTTGENIGASVAITHGLKAGDKVICQGQQKVSTGMEVNNE